MIGYAELTREAQIFQGGAHVIFANREAQEFAIQGFSRGQRRPGDTWEDHFSNKVADD